MMGTRRGFRLLILAAVAAVSTGFAVPRMAQGASSGIPAVVASDALPSDAAELQEAMDMREALGFPADPQTVSELLQRSDTKFDFGGPLSADETRLMLRRIAFEKASTDLISYVNDHQEVFGGVWFDHPGGGSRLWVATTEAANAEALSGLNDLAPAGLEVKMVSVGFSLAALRKGQEAIVGSEAELGITGSYVDITTNELAVGASADLAGDLEAKLGVPVRAEPISLSPVACGSRASCTPYRAAINLDFPNQLCTWGFIAKTNLVSQLNLVSAGHCATLGQGATHNGITVTTGAGVNRNTYDMLGTQQADALRAPLTSSANLAQPYNLLYNTDTDKALTITSTEGYLTQTVGETACFVGRMSGNVCGQIEAVGISSGTVSRFDGTTQSFNSLIRMNRATTEGDSGAPVRYGFTALGLVDFKDGAHSFHAVYAAIDKVQTAMDVKICITASCGM